MVGLDTRGRLRLSVRQRVRQAGWIPIPAEPTPSGESGQVWRRVIVLIVSTRNWSIQDTFGVHRFDSDGVLRTARCVMKMNDARIKALERQRYSDVSERQRERNSERVDHTSSILSELNEQVETPTERLETAKELLSVAGSETRTEGCNIALRHCLKLLRESAEDAGLAEYYRQQMRGMPDETVSESPSVEEHLFSEREEERQRREPVRTESDYKENLTNRGE